MISDPDSNTTRDTAINQRMAQLQQITRLVTRHVQIPGTQVSLDVTRPENIDALLDSVMDDPEQNMPYWAEIWPSGVALARELLLHPELVRGKPVIELGCGIGITAATAILCGAEITVTDYSPHSLLLTELTCLRAGLSIPPSRCVNWRDPDAHLLQESRFAWPVVLAADVLYEDRDIVPVLNVLDRITAPGGMVLLAEPGRRAARELVDHARTREWHVESRRHQGPWPESNDCASEVWLHRLTRYPTH